MYISNKYKIQIEPIQFEWEKFLPTLEKDFPDILNEILNCKTGQQHQLNSNVNRNMPNDNRNQYNTVIDNGTRMLNGAHGNAHISHSMPENSTYGSNSHSSQNTYKGWQIRRHNYYTAPFRSSYTDHDLQGFHHRGTTRSSNGFHNTYTVFEGNSLSSIMKEQIIMQAALTSIEMFDGTKHKFKAWSEAIENAAQISGQNAIYIAFSKLIGSPLLTANMLRTR